METLNFIVCPSYHGATLLSLLLNNHSAVTSLGDTIPARKYLGSACSCRRAVRDCPFWSEVLEGLEATRFTEGEKVLPLWPRISPRWQKWNRLAALGLGTVAHVAGPRTWSLVGRDRDEYADTYSRFYALVRRLHGTQLFVDGSKSMSKAFVLASIFPEADVRIIHLVRDPRDYHCSNLKNNPDTATLASSTREWLDRHLAILAMSKMIRRKKYLRIRYEDLCEQPEQTVATILGTLEVDYEDLFHPQTEGRKNHVIGNDTMADFDGTIRPSTKWRSRLTAIDVRQIERRTRPLFGRFGYRESARQAADGL
ncbi:MAG: sulfotransferase [Candidatus Palauibacterales bacterium]|nr:sulfotransferase [Candidatus Palauibacterales bacterium]MDP2482840.1 sulfotransferase [Candidatus Palauibacterales bacterium]